MELSLLCDMEIVLLIHDKASSSLIVYESETDPGFLNLDLKSFSSITCNTNKDVIKLYRQYSKSYIKKGKKLFKEDHDSIIKDKPDSILENSYKEEDKSKYGTKELNETTKKLFLKIREKMPGMRIDLPSDII